MQTQPFRYDPPDRSPPSVPVTVPQVSLKRAGSAAGTFTLARGHSAPVAGAVVTADGR
jgi:hypothetical protein